MTVPKTSSATVLMLLMSAAAMGQTAMPSAGAETQPADRIATLGLSPESADTLRKAVLARRYPEAESVLIPLVTGAARDQTTYARLVYLGGLYSLAGDSLSTAIALKKAQAIAPLETSLRFALAMAYVRIGHRDWATAELRALASAQPHEALYPYWLGRLEFDAQRYDAAVVQLKSAIALDPGMARAHDALGLCFFQQNQNGLAVKQFEEAIELERGTPRPSAWPFVNLGITQALLNQPEAAEASFRRAVQIDPRMAQAHFHLGNLLVNRDRLTEALQEFRAAAEDDPTFAEPHVALARLYRRMGDTGKSTEELAIFKRLHEGSEGMP